MSISAGLSQQLVQWRREFHRFTEPAWREFRTTSRIVSVLRGLGWDAHFGPAIHLATARLGVPEPRDRPDEVDEVEGWDRPDGRAGSSNHRADGQQAPRTLPSSHFDGGWDIDGPDPRLGVPDLDVLAQHRERAMTQGADPEMVAQMGEGFTGVVAILETGRPGPVVAFRFDIDANELQESANWAHRPTREGFASVNPGVMHGCGHDGHIAMGLGLATVLAEHRDDLTGTVKILFQPAEEGLCGAHSLTEAGWLDDVDVFLATHLMAGLGSGRICAGMNRFLASTKFDVTFKGVPAHAGADPEKGRNALLAACAATTILMAIPRHSGGTTRINVGTLNAGEARNVIAQIATLKGECRGATTEVNDFMFDQVQRIINASADMFDVASTLTVAGKAGTCPPSAKLVEFTKQKFASLDGVTQVDKYGGTSVSEDATTMMRGVQDHGGLATYVGIWMDNTWGHHTSEFDVSEEVMRFGVEAESEIALTAPDLLASV